MPLSGLPLPAEAGLQAQFVEFLESLGPLQLAVLILVSWLAGVGKVAFGIGTGIFLTPVLALVLPPKVAVGLMAPVMIVTDAAALHHHWGKWHRGHMLVLLPTCLAGVIVGILFLAWAPSGLVRKAIGTIALLFVGLQLFYYGREKGAAARPMPAWGGSIVGFVGGVVTSIAHAGGVVYSIYLLTIGLEKNTFIATVVGIFFLSNVVKLPLYWETGILTLPILLAGLALTPIMLVGGRMGFWLNRRLTVQQFTRLVVAIVGLSGAFLVATA